MEISLIPTAEQISRESLINKSAVMFDILRASSTVCTALANGCQAVLPVSEVADALALAQSLPEQTCLLGGERGAVRLPGFHLGNSPSEYTRPVVQGKTIILTTTNGTRAIRLAAAGSGLVIIGSLLNVTATARALVAAGRDVALVCAGTRGQFSLEDTLAAGLVIRQLLKLLPSGEATAPAAAPASDGPYAEERPLYKGRPLVLTDAAMAALRLAEYYSANPLQALHDSLHGQKLVQLGLASDLAYCAQVDLLEVVPVYRQGKITLAGEAAVR
ncbi:2-phosphosulfolactate phosphatase [Desulforamulus hydrothermalis]|uniref:Probable 2-phosphosulfolactate phosphatase n=1 Tax=Desulforamulus hydrothermalis Lam5 = DSM 18033 TaxID=1121428 RepID=K8E0K6_9FIRM|nr:2-phosphosulfolactate phosphatase [Desulforamulus hydrothermalis]CCO09134.1 putative 2-phosphosulfolactate phosphatase [Desulforamulus hydrothermalis Lam5 = DSM 18033]SHH11938.1 2-phosphosulfolactate phosphatase [Desulforamulus hydrothermalis Lam5 = DSM 18033]